MPIVYLCRKCVKIYSKEEFEESKFCTLCGSFLLPNFEINDQRLISSAKNLGKKAFPSRNEEDKFDTLFKERDALLRAAESLRQRIASSKEYAIVTETKNVDEQPKVHSAESWIWSSEYGEALKTRRKTPQTTQREKP